MKEIAENRENLRTGQASTPLQRHLAGILKPRQTVYLIPHDHPDPDGLASAAALGVLLRHLGYRGRIAFTGYVGRAENRELLRHIQFRWREGLPQQSRPVAAILVDTSPGAANVTLPAGYKPIAVLDHHSVFRQRGYQYDHLFAAVDPEVGATATLAYRELKAAGIRPPPWLATALAYAITTETMDLRRDFAPEDLVAYGELLQQANLRLLGQIRHAPLKREYYQWLRFALESAYTYGRVSWANLSDVDAPEVVAEIAEFLLRMERITWSFCTATAGNSIMVSLRSDRRGSRCARLLRQVISKVGSGSAGGHEQMAAGRITVQGDDVEGCRQRLVELLVRTIERGRVPDAPGAVLSAAQPLSL